MKLEWDKTGEKTFETGIDHGVLYVKDTMGAYPKGVAWNGLISVSENPSGAEPTPLYADNIKYLNLMSNEEFGATVEAYTYPEEFAACNGEAELVAGVSLGQQKRSEFGMVYRTKVGNDTDGNDHGYKLHLIYGALAAPSQRAYNTVNDSPEAITFSWELTTTPVAVTGNKPVSCLTIDSTKTSKEGMAAIEAILFGSEAEARLPLPDEVKTIIEGAAAANM